MKTIKAGMFPGSLAEYAVADDATIADVLKLANIVVGAEMDVKCDDESISLEAMIPAGARLITVSKRIKGAN